MNIEKFSDTQYEILKAVSRFQYLTLAHMVQLGICSSIQYMRRPVADLSKRQKPLLHTLNYGDNPAYGRREYMYCLTARGVAILEEWGEEKADIRAPKNPRLAAHDYQHKKNMITALIEAQKSRPINILDLYYGRATASKKQATTVNWKGKDEEPKVLSPDAILRLGKVLISLEMTNGKSYTRDKDKIPAYTVGLNLLCKKYKHPSKPVVLFVYEEETAMQNFLKWSRSESVFQSKENKGLFMAKSLSSLTDGCFFTRWHVLGKHEKIYNFKG